MLQPEQHEKITSLYTFYNEVIRPLISEIEARKEVFPAPLFNEIRAFNDHVARCYLSGMTEVKVNEELKKAEGHINRITLDCFKYLDVFLYEKVKRFEHSTRYIDISLLDNGEFYPSFCRLQKEAVKNVREAKKKEALNVERSLDLYQAAYNTYCKLEELIDAKTGEIQWAKVRFTGKMTLKIILFIATAVLSGFISVFFSCDQIREFITSLFTKIN